MKRFQVHLAPEHAGRADQLEGELSHETVDVGRGAAAHLGRRALRGGQAGYISQRVIDVAGQLNDKRLT
jgi:hypothetical protein